ncbi:hypothetical protein GMORB2_5166 [Geosmithia morbida]|uniref:gamma-glutamylcyclotransferase n=1 Tax=Geosmithia morbida TaxID=1094350 RepID=A0A9P4YX70_9HYPO|nr:uncharacterized protein GMORB2_5166 [Geosmithia morbida]KAF4124500.1 hypothetical protein GMORB2_5166 [Geosmithia morbida]
MASQPPGKQPLPPSRPTTYYFAYGSNLHLRQMKRRCPDSKYIGRARLLNHRWQINQRGYANVVAAHGHWVDGLVYEINAVDEAKLDINEGVSKNAYIKRRMDVHLHRAPNVLYRRPTSWIVDSGGPGKVLRQANNKSTTAATAAGGSNSNDNNDNHNNDNNSNDNNSSSNNNNNNNSSSSSSSSSSSKKKKNANISHHWVQKVLVYISINHVEDSSPKAEYINRINLGIADARALGVDEDYITNCIRPFIPAPAKSQDQLAVPGGGVRRKTGSPRGQKRTVSPRSGDHSPARAESSAPSPNRQERRSPSAIREENNPSRKRRVVPDENNPPTLPPRPSRKYHGEALIVVEEGLFSH